MQSWKKPTDQQVDAALQKLVKPGYLKYFLEKLDNPEWIAPLWKRGFFVSPPSPIKDEEANSVALPLWAESRYLARMAHQRPELVAQIISSMPATDNARIVEDLIDAALSMPPGVAASLASKAVEWAKCPFQMFLGEKNAAYVVLLAEGGETTAALDVARALFRLTRTPSQQIAVPELGEMELGDELLSQMDDWHYREALNLVVPVLIQKAGAPALQLFSDILAGAINRKPHRGGADDYSYIWRPAIEDHEQNQGHGYENALVDAIRDMGLSLTTSLSAASVIELLNRRKQQVFRRIAIYILGELKDAPTDLVSTALLDRAIFDDYRFQHEYAKLLESKFGSLPAGQQQRVIQWILDGPNLEGYRHRVTNHRGTPPTAEEEDAHTLRWQSERIAWFGKTPDSLVQLHKKALAAVGEPEHPSFASYHTSWVGPTAPKTVAELNELSFEGIVQFLLTWEPEPSPEAHSREGLGRELEVIATDQIQLFAKRASELKGLNTIYLRYIFRAFSMAAKEEKEVDWNAVLLLGQLIVDQPDQADVPDDDDNAPWSWTRKEIASTLENLFRSNSLTPSHRKPAFQILKKLAEDSDPTPENDATYGGDNSEPWNRAINTVRGTAFHALIQYGLWLRRLDEREENWRLSVVAPEATSILDEHLNPEHDPSPSVRSVYGQYFPWLLLMDKEWAIRSSTAIFPESSEPKSMAMRAAAWGAYISLAPAYADVLDVLSEQYHTAVVRLSDASGERTKAEAEHLAEHLMLYYLRGQLETDTGRKILSDFWKLASVELCGSALEFVGRMLRSLGPLPDGAILNRLAVLIDDRINASQSAKPVELRYFGYWFASGKFSDEWALDRLSKVLDLVRAVEDIREVMTRLVRLYDEYPHKAATIVGKVIAGIDRSWGVFSIKDALKEILGRMIASGDSDLNTSARVLIDRLGEQGHLEFRTLLPKKAS